MNDGIPEKQEKARREIEEKIREFLEAGGKIQEIPDGVLGDPLEPTYDGRKQLRLKKKGKK